MTDLSTPPFFCNLVEASQDLIDFQRDLHALGVTLAPATLKSVYRYEKLWLPLVAKHANLSSDPSHVLVPPPDIAWLWHCHRMAPFRYESYCKTILGVPALDANPPFTYMIRTGGDADSDAGGVANSDANSDGGGGGTLTINDNNYNERLRIDCTYTLKAWSNMHPNESFFDDKTEDDTAEKEAARVVLIDGFDIALSVSSQRDFLYHVSHHCYNNIGFLQEGVTRYHKFLKLKQKAGSLVVPTFQIDLAWHAHMLVSTFGYNADCIKVRGTKFNHDDTLVDRSPGSRQQNFYQQTIDLWKRQYKEPYQNRYGNFLGEPPAAYYKPDWVATNHYYRTSNLHSITKPTIFYQEATDDRERAGVYDNNPWLNPLHGAIQNGKILFMQQMASEKERALYPNRRVEDFVYGDGCLGRGYYSLHTRDAHLILLNNLHSRHVRAINERHHLVYSECSCFGRKMSQNKAQEVHSLDFMIERFESMIKYAKSRINSAGPNAKLADDMESKQ
jgi:Glycine-rich domain-containing protein-like